MLPPGETQARLEELGRAHGVEAGGVAALAAFLGLLADDASAPTSVRDPVAAVDTHVADALSALELPEVRAARAIADVGAGAGVPGLVLAAALPGARVALVESVGRKCAFLRRAADVMTLPAVEIVCGRAEEWREGIGTRDLVTARAVAPLNVLCEYAAPLLSPGGAFVAWKGARDPAEEAAGDAAAAALGLELAGVRAVTPFAAAERRHLYLYSKVQETPPKYPRRAGMARKRPIRPST